MSKYYLITLKNVRSYEARDLRANGVALARLDSLIAPGRLEFLARPREPVGGLASFTSMTGITTELDVIDPADPRRRRTLSGRVISVIVNPPRPRPPGPPEETIAFYYQSSR